MVTETVRSSGWQRLLCGQRPLQMEGLDLGVGVGGGVGWAEGPGQAGLATAAAPANDLLA